MTTQDPLPARSRPDLRLVHGERGAAGRVVVVGGGIAGLAAAHTIARDGGPGVRVTLVEGAEQFGGKLRLGEVAGLQLDTGAESMQATRPEAVGLTRAVGLDRDLVFPAASGAGIWVRGRIRPMPPSVMGVPTDLRALTASGVLPLSAVLRLPLEPLRAPTPFDRDVSVGAYVEARLGREVVDTLVEPLLGGVYAGRADALSLRATVPTLYREIRGERSLLRAAGRVSRGGSRESGARRGPVFAGINGGLGRLPGAVAADLRSLGATILLGRSARSLHRHGDGWRVVVGPVAEQEVLEADAVVLAVPGYSASGLLSHIVPSVSSDLGLLKHASMAVVALAYRVADVPAELVGTGFLVPPGQGRTVKGVTYSSAKWGWLGTRARSSHSDGLLVLRASIGRIGDDEVLGRDDREIAALAHEDLQEALGILRPPVDVQVTRWEHALPQYAVGHADRIERVRSRVADIPGLELCGAAFDGVGVAAVIGSARSAASGVLRYLREGAQSGHG
jgi:oxygen-dependent protoporphyrinogen oxidase